MVRGCLHVLVATAVLWSLISQALSNERDIHVATSGTPDPRACWAVIIGIDEYHHWPKLTTAVRDAKEVRAVLIERYGFPEDQVILLINDQATQKNILSALRSLGKRVRKDHDSLLIYYAGHGLLDDLLETGYWVPVEAQHHAVDDFIDNAVIFNYIRGIDTLHTLLVADSSFAGSLFVPGPSTVPSEVGAAYFERVYRLKSRQGFTSGNVEPVADSGLGGHSIFAYYFIKALKENRDPYLVPSTLFERIKIPLARNSMQTPIFKPLKDAKDEGGEFVFVLKEPVAEVSPKEDTSLALSPGGKADLDARMRALEEERRRLQAEIRLLEEEEKKLFHEHKKIDEEQSKLDELRKALEAQLASFQKEKEAQSAVSKEPVPEVRPPKAPPSKPPSASKQPPAPIAPLEGPTEAKEHLLTKKPSQLTQPTERRIGEARGTLEGLKKTLKAQLASSPKGRKSWKDDFEEPETAPSPAETHGALSDLPVSKARLSKAQSPGASAFSKELAKPVVPPESRLEDGTVDRILKKMELGNVAFNAPQSMNLKQTILIELVLSLSKPIEELKQRIEAEGERDGARICITNRMQARLTGVNFQITAVTPEEQAITLGDVTEWKWEIKPMRPGLQRLHLTLTALFTLDGTSASRAVRTFDRTIEVKVTWGQRASGFVRGNWQWLWAAIIVPIVGWLWKRRRKNKLHQGNRKNERAIDQKTRRHGT